MKELVAKSCQILCNPRDCSPPGSSVHGILQGRILEWVAIPFSSRSSQPMDHTQGRVDDLFNVMFCLFQMCSQMIQLYMCVCVYLCSFIYIYVCVYIYIYIYIYLSTHLFVKKSLLFYALRIFKYCMNHLFIFCWGFHVYVHEKYWSVLSFSCTLPSFDIKVSFVRWKKSFFTDLLFIKV